jgi:hypothetical protein
LLTAELSVVFCGLDEAESTDAGFAIEEHAVSKPMAAEPPINSLRFTVRLPVVSYAFSNA